MKLGSRPKKRLERAKMESRLNLKPSRALKETAIFDDFVGRVKFRV